MTINTDFEKLFLSYLENKQITREQYLFLQRLIAEGTDDKFVLEQIDKLLQSKKVNETLGEEADHLILSRILSADNKISKYQRRFKVRYLVGGMVAAASILLFIFITNLSKKEMSLAELSLHTQKKEALHISEVNTNKISFSGKRSISMPDGSTVILNENSQLSYNNDFNEQKREVQLIGEAFFDIKHDESRPFIVHTGKVETTVLGTAFNVKADPELTKVEVTVIRGRVKVGERGTTFGVITPNQQIDVNTTTSEHKQLDVNAALIASWKDEYLFLNDLSLGEAMGVIEQHYGVKVRFKDDQLKDIRINATFEDKADLKHVMDVVSAVAETQYQFDDKQNIAIFR